MKTLGILTCFVLACSLFSQLSRAEELSTNETLFLNPPNWLTENKVNKAVDSVQRYMEWDIRKVKVKWYSDQEQFKKFHGYDSSVVAVSVKQENTIHLGPKVTSSNFTDIFGHELVHIILYQKYKTAIPQWLEEGLANYVSKHGQVDYNWLASQSQVSAHSLIHPFQNLLYPGQTSTTSSRYHYQASTALIELIASKCRLKDLLQLSVGEKLESYLPTFCRISDIDSDFKKWVQKKSTHGVNKKF